MSFARPLRHSQFRRVWFGQAISSIGDGIFAVALIGLILQSHRNSDLGYVMAAEGAAMVAMSLVGGVLADRMRRSRAMALSEMVRLLAVTGFVLGAAQGPLILSLVLAAMMGAGAALFQPAFGALTPSLVPDEDLPAANALRSMTTRAAAVIGPALGGLLLALSGPRMALLVDVATFAVSVLFLIGIKDRAPQRDTPQNVFREAHAGLSAVAARPWVLTIILQGTVQLLLVMGPALVLLPILLKDRGHFAAYGVMVGLQALGSVLGGLTVSAYQPRQPGVAGVCALALLSLQLLALGLDLPLYVLGATMVATGFGYSVFGVLWSSALQRSIPGELLGRVMSVEMLGTFALAPVGLALAPLAITAWGTQPVLLGALVVLLVSTVLPLAQRDVRRFADTAPPADAATGIRDADPGDDDTADDADEPATRRPVARTEPS
ncbi:MFS transporter [Micromonospora sonneratiae]|uniref:MFS transporter n=1 Tax=Micromonospora sonneratiae TaxID=1184706 RepID=A0ABW3YRK3_9ACTN